MTTSLEAPLYMFYRGGVPGRKVDSVMALPGKVFHICSQNVGDTHLTLSPNNLLWFHGSLEEFFKLENGFL